MGGRNTSAMPYIVPVTILSRVMMVLSVLIILMSIHIELASGNSRLCCVSITGT